MTILVVIDNAENIRKFEKFIVVKIWIDVQSRNQVLPETTFSPLGLVKKNASELNLLSYGVYFFYIQNKNVIIVIVKSIFVFL